MASLEEERRLRARAKISMARPKSEAALHKLAEWSLASKRAGVEAESRPASPMSSWSRSKSVRQLMTGTGGSPRGRPDTGASRSSRRERAGERLPPPGRPSSRASLRRASGAGEQLSALLQVELPSGGLSKSMLRRSGREAEEAAPPPMRLLGGKYTSARHEIVALADWYAGQMALVHGRYRCEAEEVMIDGLRYWPAAYWAELKRVQTSTVYELARQMGTECSQRGDLLSQLWMDEMAAVEQLRAQSAADVRTMQRHADKVDKAMKQQERKFLARVVEMEKANGALRLSCRSKIRNSKVEARQKALELESFRGDVQRLLQVLAHQVKHMLVMLNIPYPVDDTLTGTDMLSSLVNTMTDAQAHLASKEGRSLFMKEEIEDDMTRLRSELTKAAEEVRHLQTQLSQERERREMAEIELLKLLRKNRAAIAERVRLVDHASVQTDPVPELLVPLAERTADQLGGTGSGGDYSLPAWMLLGMESEEEWEEEEESESESEDDGGYDSDISESTRRRRRKRKERYRRRKEKQRRWKAARAAHRVARKAAIAKAKETGALAAAAAAAAAVRDAESGGADAAAAGAEGKETAAKEEEKVWGKSKAKWRTLSDIVSIATRKKGKKAASGGSGGAGSSGSSKRRAAGPRRAMPKRTLLRIIQQIYDDKIATDKVDDRENNHRTSMVDFVYDFFTHMYGLRSIAISKIQEMLKALKQFNKESTRIHWFGVMVGMGDASASSQSMADFFLLALDTLQTLGKIIVDEKREDTARLVRTDVSLIATSRVVTRFRDPSKTSHKLLVDSDDKYKEVFARVRALPITKVDNVLDYYEMDAVMDVLTSFYVQEQHDKVARMKALFEAADDNGDGLLTFDEFSDMVYTINASAPPEDIISHFKEGLKTSSDAECLTPRSFSSLVHTRWQFFSSASEGSPEDGTDELLMAILPPEVLAARRLEEEAAARPDSAAGSDITSLLSARSSIASRPESPTRQPARKKTIVTAVLPPLPDLSEL